MNLTVSELLLAFLQDRSFAGRVANALPHVSQPGLGTMAIGLYNGRITLFTDPEFVKRVSLQFGHFCMEHEILGHYSNAHIPRFIEFLSRFPNPEDKLRARNVFQVAVDCATNSLLRRTKHFDTADKEMLAYSKWKDPETAHLIPEDLKGGLILPERFALEPDKSLEWYLAELMKRTGLGQPRRTIDQEEFYEWLVEMLTQYGDGNHDKWPTFDEVMTMSPDELHSLAHQLHNQTKHVLRKVVKEMKRSGCGTMPGGLQEFLDDYLAEPIVPWWELFASRIQTAKNEKIERGVMRPNRTLLAMSEEDPEILPSIGVTKDAAWRIFMLEDTSGSMGTDVIKIGLSETQHILDMDEDMEVRLIQFDTQMQFDKLFKHGDKLPAEAHGRGGTDFDGAHRYLWEHYLGNDAVAPDCVVIFTDGGAPAVSPDLWLPEIPVIWCVTHDGSAGHLREAGYGDVIVCSEDQNEMWKHMKEGLS